MNLLTKHIPGMTATAVILFLCLYPFSSEHRESHWMFPQFDKLVHFGLHFLLVAVVMNDFRRSGFYGFPVKKTMLIVILYSFFLGVIIEILQDVMGLGRAFDIFDVLANTCGAVLAGLLAGTRFSR